MAPRKMGADALMLYNTGYGKHVRFWIVRPDFARARDFGRVPARRRLGYIVLVGLPGGADGSVGACRGLVFRRMANEFIRQFVDDHCR